MNLGSKHQRRRQSITVNYDNIRSIESLDWDQVRAKVRSIVPQGSKQIRGLSPVDDTVFKELVHQVRSIYDSPSEYEKLRTIVSSEFGDAKNITPGTVSAYFLGCLGESSVTPKGCNPLCAGAMPLSREIGGENSFCEYPVFLMEGDGSSTARSMTMLNQTDDSSRAIVYTSARSLDEFAGFSPAEIQELRERGVDTVRLLSYSSEDLLGTDVWKSLTGLKTRDTADVSSTSSNRGWVIFGFILIVLLILFVVYLAMRK